MKKLILLIVLVLSVSIFTVNAQTPIVDSVNNAINLPDTATVTFSKVYNDMKTGITAIASALKIGVEHVYTVLVKQQIITSIYWLIYLIMCIPFSFFIYKGVKWVWIKDTPESRDEERITSIIAIVSGCILTITIWGIGMNNLFTMLTGFINPEYGAIKEILNFIR